MEENGKKNRRCSWCVYYHVYYVKGNTQFNRANAGYCVKRNKVVANKEGENCEEWRYLVRRRKDAFETTFPLAVLSKIVTQLSGIRQILQEAQEEDPQ